MHNSWTEFQSILQYGGVFFFFRLAFLLGALSSEKQNANVLAF